MKKRKNKKKKTIKQRKFQRIYKQTKNKHWEKEQVKKRNKQATKIQKFQKQTNKQSNKQKNQLPMRSMCFAMSVASTISIQSFRTLCFVLADKFWKMSCPLSCKICRRRKKNTRSFSSKSGPVGVLFDHPEETSMPSKFVLALVQLNYTQ